MIIKKRGNHHVIVLEDTEKVSGHKPSVDVLFYSISKLQTNKTLGVLLTGMGSDGAKGLLSMKKKCGFTIGQDEKSSIVYGMPKVAYEIGAVDEQVALDRIANRILELV
jgi:two-component system chemotaxis response regulator CheB